MQTGARRNSHGGALEAKMCATSFSVNLFNLKLGRDALIHNSQFTNAKKKLYILQKY
jgi:hypothetical protein